MHDRAARISLEDDEIKKNRPVYDGDFLVKQFYSEIKSSTLFDNDHRKILLNLADKILENFPEDQGFIHGDFHVGNLLTRDNKFTVLDFDECGFGSRYYDIGTMHLHTLAKNNMMGWQSFLEGYGLDKNDSRIPYGTASRIFYMIGTIPRRIDIIKNWDLYI